MYMHNDMEEDNPERVRYAENTVKGGKHE